VKREKPTNYTITVEPTGRSRDSRQTVALVHQAQKNGFVIFKVLKNGKIFGEIAHVPEQGEITLAWKALALVGTKIRPPGRYERKPDEGNNRGGTPGTVSE
jgi:hypothetical protein